MGDGEISVTVGLPELPQPLPLPAPVASPIPTTARPPSRMTLLTATKSRQVCLLDHLDPIGFRTFLPHLFNETNTLVARKVLNPARSTALMWTKTSFPP